MGKYYDIKNISKDRWKDNITLHLSEGAGRGYSYHSLLPGDVLESVPEEKISNQVRLLTKQKRSRPPVVQLVEVDYEARQAQKEKELAIIKSRGEKKMARRKAELGQEKEATTEGAPLKETSKKSKKSRKKSSEDSQVSDLSADERAALEAGEDFPGN